MKNGPGALIGLVAVIALIPLAFGALVIQQRLTADPSAAVPATLTAGAVGTPTIGASGTSAAVTYLSLGSAATMLNVADGAGTPAWNVQVKAISVTGLGVTDSVTVVLRLGANVQTQVVATGLSGITQSIGTAITLPNGGGPIEIRASGGVLLGTATATLQVVLTPAAGGTMSLTYPVTFTLG